FGLLAAFNLVSDDRARLAGSLRDLTDQAPGVVGGRPPARRGTAHPTAPSLLDARSGLHDRRPRELVRMPFLANDRLAPAQSHGDLLLALSADQPDVLLHALRQLVRRRRENLVLHWMLDGYNRPDAKPGAGRTDN